MDDLFAAEDPSPERARPRRSGEVRLSDLPRETQSAEPDGRPLAERLRPQRFEEFLGQEDLLGAQAPLRRLIAADRVPSMIFWGPPGCGKTTLARLIASESRADFIQLSAVTANVRDVRAVVDTAKANRKFARRTILFIDEIHRFNKAQQDAFLPHVESGIITLIGATTENPSFSVISPLLSRCRVFVLKPMAEANLVGLLERGLARANEERPPAAPALSAEPGALLAIARLCDGDARRALGMLDVCAALKLAGGDDAPIAAADVAAVAQRHLIYDREGEEHYNLISALHKTMRSSDPHGAAYWLGRMLAAGEDPLYLARRIVRFAAEDVGLADPRALGVAMEAMRAYQALGTPEGEVALFQAAIYLAMAPKSNSAYMAQKAVQAEIAATGTLAVPLALRNAPTKLMQELDYGRGYTYDHDAEGGFAPKQGLPDEIAGRRFYEPGNRGEEAAARERLAEWDARRDAGG